MASRTKIVTFDAWRGGEFGDLGATAAPRRSFHGKNVMVYQNGLLGPRPGVKQLSPSGMPTGAAWALRGLGPEITNGIVLGIGAAFYGFTYSPLGAVTSLGSVAGAPSDPSQVIQYGNLGYAVLYGDKAYKIDPAAPSVTALASAPGGRTIAQYGVRTIDASVASNPNRVYYSAADDPTSWPALNYFDVGSDDWAVVHVEESRNRLAIQNTGQEIWTLSGVPGVNDSLKRTSRGDLAASDWYNVARIGESLWFIPYGEDFPVQFTGTITDKLAFRHLRFTEGAGNAVALTALPGSDTVCAVESGGENRMMVLHNDVWSFHELDITTSRLVSPVSIGGVSYRENPLLICDGGSASAAPKVYIWSPTLERPGKASDTLAQPGDNSTTPIDAEVSTPEWWSEDNSEVLVRTVSVDFAKWNTGSSSSNHFDIAIESLHRFGETAARTSVTQEWDEVPSETTEDAQTTRKVFRFGDQGLGHGFRVHVTNMRGMALDNIYCEIELSPSR